MPDRFCHVSCCHGKPAHRCLSCDDHFCQIHSAKRNTWGNFWLEEEGDLKIPERVLHVPFRHWSFLVCDRCSRIEHRVTLREFVENFPFFIKWLKKELWKPCWTLFKEIRNIGDSFQEKSRWAAIYFPGVDSFLELEDPATLEKEYSSSSFPFETDRWETVFSLARRVL